MFCAKCGKELPDGSKFCPACGEKTELPESGAAPKSKRKQKMQIRSEKDIQGEKVTENIYLCRDGVYRWAYEVPMLKNPTILFTVWKVLGMAFGMVFLFVTLIDLVEGNRSASDLWGNARLFLLLAAIFLVISVLAYVIVAAIYGWKYAVLFEMEETEIRHIQMPRQRKKAELIGMITALAGLAGKNLSVTGAGITAGTRTTSTSEYAKVRRIIPIPRRHVIKVNQRLDHNQIYADPGDFDFVLAYLRAHCPNAE